MLCQKKVSILPLVALLLSPAFLRGQPQSEDAVWTLLDTKEVQTLEFQPAPGVSGLFAAFGLNQARIDGILKAAPREFSEQAERSPALVSIPFPDGSFERFRVEESPVIEKPLESVGHETYTYKGIGIDDPSATIRFERAFDGFHAMVRSSRGIFYVDPSSTKPTSPDNKPYLSYFASARVNPPRKLHCEVSGDRVKQDRQRLSLRKKPVPRPAQTQSFVSETQMLHVYRIALAVNSYYVEAVYNKNLPASLFDQAAAAVTRTLNRINGVYESELAIHLNMVVKEASLIYADADRDPYRNVNSNAGAALALNQNNLDAVVGSSNYDIGHLFTTDTAGLASVGSVCNTEYKAQGVTGIGNPTGDSFDVDYVAHEIGHQFGANHTFNAISGYCKGNRNPDTAYEPGSGSTIMGYAGDGICDPASLQDHSDSYFHVASLIEIRDYATDTATGGGGSCGTSRPLSYTAPPAIASAAYTIPKGTPFVLSTDIHHGAPVPFVFAWEEFDLGDPAPPDDENGPNPTPRPLFRSKSPSSSTERFFPSFGSLIEAPGAPTRGEALPMLDRTMKFRMTARNNHGSFGYREVAVKVDPSSGPFTVLLSVGGNSWQRGTIHKLRWNPAHTDRAPVNCSRVRLQLAIDEDPSKLFTLAQNIPNSGSYDLTVPTGTPLTAHGRLILRSEGNVFLAVSPFNIQITPISQ
jgi:hypothetical protein